MAVWYYSRNGQAIGPLEEPQVLALAASGKIRREDMVWREGMPEWIDAVEAGLFKPPASPFASPAVQVVDPEVSEELRSTRMIEESRALIGPTPRDLTMSPYLQFTAAGLAGQRQRPICFGKSTAAKDVLYRNGTVVWACFIKAGPAAISPGKEDCSAAVVYSPHRWFDAKLGELARLAQTVGELKDKQHIDEETAEFARLLFDEKSRAPRLAVPHKIFGEFPAFHASIVVVRKHLPFGFVTNAMVPILIDPKATAAVMILPSQYWSPLLLAAWERGVRASGINVPPGLPPRQ